METLLGRMAANEGGGVGLTEYVEMAQPVSRTVSRTVSRSAVSANRFHIAIPPDRSFGMLT
jgi:hypothetical protein